MSIKNQYILLNSNIKIVFLSKRLHCILRKHKQNMKNKKQMKKNNNKK